MKAPPVVVVKSYPTGLDAAGTCRPSLPVSQFANDFSLLLRAPRRLRLVRGRIYVLS